MLWLNALEMNSFKKEKKESLEISLHCVCVRLEFNIHKYKFLLSSICDAFWHHILYSVYLKVDCFQSWPCWGDNEHAGETVWVPNIKFIYSLPDAARAWSKRIVMSSGLGYGNFFSPAQNKLGLRRPSTNCLGTDAMEREALVPECIGQTDLSSRTHHIISVLYTVGFCITAAASHKCVKSLLFFKEIGQRGHCDPWRKHGDTCYWVDQQLGSSVKKTLAFHLWCRTD